MADKKISEFTTFDGEFTERIYYVIASGETNDPNSDNYKLSHVDLQAGLFAGDVNFDGDVGIKGNLYVTGTGFFDSDIIVSGTGYFEKDLFVGDNLYVSGTGFFGDDLIVSGNFFGEKSGFIKEDFFIGDDLTVTGSTSIGENLIVSGTGFFKDDLFVGDDLTVSGDFKVEGDSVFEGDTNIEGHLRLGKNLYVSGSGFIKEDFFVSGKSYVKDDFAVSGDANIKDTLTISGDVFAKEDLFVDADTFLSGNAHVGENLFVSGSGFFEKDVRVGENLDVTGQILLKGQFGTEGQVIKVVKEGSTNVLKWSSDSARSDEEIQDLIFNNITSAGGVTIDYKDNGDSLGTFEIAGGGDSNVKSDWEEDTSTVDAHILNRPSALVPSSWSDTEQYAFLRLMQNGTDNGQPVYELQWNKIWSTDDNLINLSTEDNSLIPSYSAQAAAKLLVTSKHSDGHTTLAWEDGRSDWSNENNTTHLDYIKGVPAEFRPSAAAATNENLFLQVYKKNNSTYAFRWQRLFGSGNDLIPDFDGKSTNSVLRVVKNETGASPTYTLQWTDGQSDWSATTAEDLDYIKNIPDALRPSGYETTASINPKLGYVLTVNGSARNDLAWIRPNSVEVSSSAPSAPSKGDLWFDTTVAELYVRRDSDWMQTNAGLCNGVARALVSFNGASNNLFASATRNYNIKAILDEGAGQYEVEFNNSISNPVCFVTHELASSASGPSIISASDTKVKIRTSADSTIHFVAF